MQLLFSALLSMGVTVMLIPPLIKWAGKLGVLDQPGGRKAHARPIPRVGGIAMGLAMLLAIIVWKTAGTQINAFLLAILLLLAFGIQDDRLTLSPTWKLIGQILAALIVIFLGDIHIGIVRHVDMHEIPLWLSLPLTVAFIVGVTNAINLADGLDGLAGGTTLLCLSGLLLLALTSGSMTVALVCVVTMGAVLGFLRYNTHPAQIFMGDAGSQLLGFCVAVVSLILTQDTQLPFSAALPLLLMGVPVIDTLAVMTERLLDGRSPFQADRIHVHHRLLALGFEHHEAVIAIYLTQAVLLVAAWYLRFTSDIMIMLVFICIALAIVGLLRVARQRSWQLRANTVKQQQSWLVLQLTWLREDERLNRWAGYAIGASVLGYVLILIANGVAAPTDIKLLALASACVVLIGTLKHRGSGQAGFIERAGLYISVLIAVSLDRSGNLSQSLKFYLEILVFGSLLLALTVRLYLSADRRMRITPLDTLLLLVAIALPNLPGSLISEYAAGWAVAKAFLLLYAIENMALSSRLQWHILTGGTLVFLSAVVVTGSVT